MWRFSIALAAALFVGAACSEKKQVKNKFEIAPAVQARIDQMKTEAAGWAADPRITAAVAAQNRKGPIDGMDNKKWKALAKQAPEVEPFATNDAAKFLAEKAKASGGFVSEAFLNAALGEKVAFLAKTSSYLHAGSKKFDVPFTTRKAWQGELEFDESSQTHSVQIAVPVLDPVETTKAIGVLVLGLNLTYASSFAAPGK
jgi:hypothetical protein